MKCEVCGVTMAQGAMLYRASPKGEPLVWRCERHVEKDHGSETRKLVEALKGKAGPAT